MSLVSLPSSCPGVLRLADGSTFTGTLGGHQKMAAGEVVFNTGMVGYPEALTDPSYHDQLLVLTYPLVGNYGAPPAGLRGVHDGHVESAKIHVAGLIVSELSETYSHWAAVRSLSAWLLEEGVPVLSGVDTRAITTHLREQGTVPGLIGPADWPETSCDRVSTHPVSSVSVKTRITYEAGPKRVVLVDCGCKHSIISGLLERNLTVIRVPWNTDLRRERFDALVISNGPGDPKQCGETVEHIAHAMSTNVPMLGICLGHQLLALAAGANTYKMKFGHRSQNQPCVEVGTKRCHMTSQNHGYAVEEGSLTKGWLPWFYNANDHSNEGIRHNSRPWMGVQFHPEAAPGPTDTEFVFNELLMRINAR